MANELIDPLTGEVIDDTSADAMLQAYSRLEEVDRAIYDFKCAVRDRIGRMTSGDAKTRRVRGEKWRAVVTMPDSKLDQSQIKSVWNAYPQFRDQCLKIGIIDLKKREWGKIANESGPDDFMNFKKMVLAAILPPTGLPSIKIESDISNEATKQADPVAQESLDEEKLW